MTIAFIEEGIQFDTHIIAWKRYRMGLLRRNCMCDECIYADRYDVEAHEYYVSQGMIK